MQLTSCYFSAQFCLIYLLFHSPHGTAIRGDNVRSARENEFPFTVAISYTDNENHNIPVGVSQFCTGSLITKNHVLTAEHCIIQEEVENVVILVGSIDLNNCKAYKPKSWITYREWKYQDSEMIPPYVHDIAVITLVNRVRGVQPAVIPTFKPEDLFGSEVKSAGWGMTNGKVKPSVLQIVNLKVLTKTTCESEMSRLEKENVTLSDWELCAMSDPWALLGCGDSGGPLINDRNELIAIAMGTCPAGGAIFKKFFRLHIYWSCLLNQRVNLLASLHHYEDFVRNFTG